MRPPDFWNNPPERPGWQAHLLAPLAKVWQGVTARKLLKGAWETLPVPVVCIGNINAGGTGKTPVVIMLLRAFLERGVQAHVVSRGYGGPEIGPTRVDETKHNSAQMGDEPLLISAFGPVWVAKDREQGARAAIKAGAEVILLDDGFQNPGLHKDISIIVVDAVAGFGNGKVMPAGPLREPVKTGLARGDLVISIGSEAAQERLRSTWPELDNIERYNADLVPLQTGMDWTDLRVIAFAGIGRPAKFFQSLKAQGADIIATHEFADHAEYQPAALQRLLHEAQKKSAQLVTTEKDAMRLPPAFLREVLTLPVRLELSDPSRLDDLLDRLFP